MASNVIILYGGKKQTIKTTPMMPLKQIVKLACDKQGFTDIENYGLKHIKNNLDLSLPVRFANLAPGTKLELIRVTPKARSEVTIALQMDDGGRIVEKFPPKITLWEILLHFESTSKDKSLNLVKRTAPAPQANKGMWKKFGGKPNNKLFYQQPVCLLLNQEYGTISLLKSTTLQSAGITSGNVLLRVLFRHTEQSLDDVLREINTPVQSSTETSPADAGTSAQQITLTSTSKVEPIKETSMQVNSSELTEEKDMQTKSAESTEERIDSSEEANMKVNSMESIKETSVQINSVETSESLAPVESKSGTLSTESQEVDVMDIDTKSSDVQDKNSEDQEPIEKVNIVQPSSTQASPDTNADKSDKGHFDRDVKVFNPPPENTTLSAEFDFPDSFYELTPSELKYLLAVQSSKRKAEGHAGFKTHAIREQEEKARERKYPKTLIRVRFPDSFQIQMAFLSSETIGQLYEFVKGALRTPQRPFYLYTSPPKKELTDMSASLYHAELAPSSVVNFSWTNKLPDLEPLLSDEYLKLRIDIPIPYENVDNLTSNTISEQSSSFNNEGGHVLSEPSRQRNEPAQEQRSHAHSSSKTSNNIPKWFKFGKK